MPASSATCLGRSRLQLLPAAFRPIRLRDQRDHLVARLDQRGERGHGELGRAEERDAERR
jgi:hypothetical protein